MNKIDKYELLFWSLIITIMIELNLLFTFSHKSMFLEYALDTHRNNR